MKRHKSTVLSVLLIVLLMGAAAQAQGVDVQLGTGDFVQSSV